MSLGLNLNTTSLTMNWKPSPSCLDFKLEARLLLSTLRLTSIKILPSTLQIDTGSYVLELQRGLSGWWSSEKKRAGLNSYDRDLVKPSESAALLHRTVSSIWEDCFRYADHSSC